MTLEQLQKGIKIAGEIKECKRYIESARYTQSESVVIRRTYLKVDGLEETIEVPESLFRTVGKLLLSEYNQKLIELESEFRAL